MIGYSLVILILECIYFYVPAEKEDAVSNFWSMECTEIGKRKKIIQNKFF